MVKTIPKGTRHANARTIATHGRSARLAAAVSLVLLCGPLASLPASAAAPPSGWQGLALVDSSDESAYAPGIAVNDAGQAVAAWCQWDGAEYDLYGSRYTPGMGWEPQVPVMDGNWTACVRPELDINNAGEAAAAWGIPDGFYMDTWVARMTWAGGWEDPFKADDSSEQAYPVGVNIAEDGVVVVTWLGSDGSKNNVGTRTYQPGVGWGTPFDADRSTNFVNGASMGGNPNNTVVAIWEDWDGARNNAVASVHVQGTGWGLRQSLETSDDITLDSRVAVDASGAATAVWRQADAGFLSVWAARKEPGQPWGNATLVEHNDGGPVTGVAVAAGADGKAYVSWVQYGGAYNVAMVSEYLPSSGWQAPASPAVADVGDAYDFSALASNSQGDVFFAFGIFTGSQAVQWVVRNHGAAGWEQPQRLETSSWSVGFPRLAVAATGEAWAFVEIANEVSSDVVANHFLPPDDVAPAMSLTSPPDGLRTNVSSVRVAGTTEPGATVSAAGISGFVDAVGRFDFRVPLTPGANTIAVTAWDASGNSMGATVTVHFDDPAVALAAAAVNATAAASAVQADLALEQANLSAAHARLTALEADGATTDAQLTAARNDVTAAQGQIAALQASLAAANARINQTGGSAAPVDSTPMILGILGIVLGAAALGVAMMARGAPNRGGRIGIGQVSGVRLEPPAEPGEPPKAPSDTRIER